MTITKYERGIILEADLGLYGSDPNPQLHIAIRDKNGWNSFHAFKGKKIIEILRQFRGDYTTNSTIKNLIHREILIEKTQGTIKPKKIAADPTKEWITGDI